jgi:putative transposase
MSRFRRMKTVQKFSSLHASLRDHLALERHLVSREMDKLRRPAPPTEWRSARGQTPPNSKRSRV